MAPPPAAGASASWHRAAAPATHLPPPAAWRPVPQPAQRGQLGPQPRPPWLTPSDRIPGWVTQSGSPTSRAGRRWEAAAATSFDGVFSGRRRAAGAPEFFGTRPRETARVRPAQQALARSIETRASHRPQGNGPWWAECPCGHLDARWARGRLSPNATIRPSCLFAAATPGRTALGATGPSVSGLLPPNP